MPEAVANPIILLDPVSMLLAYPTTLHSVLYNDRASLSRFLTWFFVSTELGTAHVLRRHFHWYNQVFFARDLNQLAPSVLVLAEEDAIVASSYVSEHITAKGMKSDILCLPGFKHGELLFSSCVLAHINNWLDLQKELASVVGLEEDLSPTLDRDCSSMSILDVGQQRTGLSDAEIADASSDDGSCSSGVFP